MREFDEVVKEQILVTLDELGVLVKGIILFGSKARDDFDKYSDYDILIITERTFPIKEKIGMGERIRDRLANLRIASDLFIKSEAEIEYFKNKIGCVVREALKEGIFL